MTVLWYAIGIYMIGVAIVLYLRPRTMFRENGMWKEFGLATETEQTIFPFWMFSIIWAILSYALANLISIFFASVALKSENTTTTTTTNTMPNSSFIQPISSHPNAMPVVAPQLPTAIQAAMPTTSNLSATSARVPGYYILDPYANPAHPRYIYYGPDPPGMQ
jgi:hypothetical protein